MTPTPAVRRGGRWLGCEDRIAWLLRVNRLYGADRRLAVGREFARALSATRVAPGGPGGSSGPERSSRPEGSGRPERSSRPEGSGRAGGHTPGGVDAAQVTRWERVTQRAEYDVIRQYEKLLGLEDGGVAILADTVYREARGHPGPPTLERLPSRQPAELRRRTWDLIERALGSDVMTGRAWDELTINLWQLGSVFLHPRHVWSDLIGRLLAEMIIADGTAWLRRSEALNRLLGHPDSDLAVIDACSSLAADRTNQVFIEPLTLLEVSPNPLAASRLFDQVVNPTNDHARRGAWWAVAEKVGRGHFTEPDLGRLSDQAILHLTSPGTDPACRLAAAEFMRQVRRPAPAITRALRRLAETDPEARNVLLTGRSGEPRTSHVVVSRLSTAALAHMPFDVLDSDPILDTLLGEMLFHPQISRRVQASKLIEATPYRVPIGDALVAELRRPATIVDTPLAATLLSAASHLCEPNGRRLMERFVLDPSLPIAIAETATWALAHNRGTSDRSFWSAACDRLFSLHAGASSAAVISATRGLVYSLGVSRDTTMLRRIRLDPAAPAAARAAATWWLNMPQHVLDSAAR